jgi:excinuclease UvrABC helicase subunit UvrB
MLPSEETQTIQVDAIHDANATELSIYQTDAMAKLVQQFMEGYNIAILTYGQTGSGKTFAFEGDKDHNGIIFQAISDLYAIKNPNATIKCSFVQLYNEKITDMLCPEAGG